MQTVFICDYVRTPIGRYGGGLAAVRTDDLAAIPLAHLLNQHPYLADQTDEVVLGCANQAGEDNRNVARMASLLAGFSPAVAGMTINRLCASGMDAVIAAARAIKTSEANIIIAGGVESMSRAPFIIPKTENAYNRNADIYDSTIGWRFINCLMREKYGVDSMPETAENVAADYQINRADQDAFAYRSQQRTQQAAAWQQQEIVSVEISRHKKEPFVMQADEHPRPDTTPEALAKLPTPFRPNGTITAGNSSGINDGAAALLLASAAAVKKHQLVPIAVITAAAAAGVAPRIMGMGPVAAVTNLCNRLQCKVTDFDIIELNEAFAAQALAVLRQLHIADDADYVNPNGGAIALGHPLGMSGARLCGSAARALAQQGGKRALATMCVGVGQGVAIALEAI